MEKCQSKLVCHSAICVCVCVAVRWVCLAFIFQPPPPAPSRCIMGLAAARQSRRPFPLRKFTRLHLHEHFMRLIMCAPLRASVHDEPRSRLLVRTTSPPQAATAARELSRARRRSPRATATHLKYQVVFRCSVQYLSVQ